MTNEQHLKHTMALLDWCEGRDLTPHNAAAVMGMALCSLFASRAAADEIINALCGFADAQFPSHTCTVCGQSFNPTREDAVYCSPACRQYSYRKRRAAP